MSRPRTAKTAAIDYAKLANQSVARRRRSVKVPKDLRAEQHAKFVAALSAEGLPLPVTEYKFALAPMGRRWAMDYVWLPQRVFLEVDGGVFAKGEDGQTGGRHNRGAGWLKDTEKLNAAAALGYRHLRCMPRQLASAELIATIRAALSLTEEAE